MFVLQLLGHSGTEWLAFAITAFAGGAFGAALGAYPALALSGIVVIGGEVLSLLTRGLSSAGQAVSVGFTGQIALGPVLGPHVAFAGGAAAAAYAARKGYVNSGFTYFEAKNVRVPLGSRPDVLAVGGAFGVVGMALSQVAGNAGLPLDPIMLAVVLSALLHRVVLGYPLLGTVRGAGFFDMTPYERGEKRAPQGGLASDGGQPTDGEQAPASGQSAAQPTGQPAGEATPDAAGQGGAAGASQRGAGGAGFQHRFAVEPWLPHMYQWNGVAMLGFLVGVLGGYTAMVSGSYFLAFGFSAATLLFLSAGLDRTPVTYHMALPASAAAVAYAGGFGAMELLPTLLVGGLFGLLAGVIGEASQRVFYAHADTHFEPPAAAILVTSLLIGLLAEAGVFQSAAYLPV
jgi:hypothetical protein